MNTRSTLVMFAALAAVASNPRPMAAAEPPAPAVSLQFHSARVTRASADLAKRFPGRYYGEGNPGVSLTLMLTLKEGFMLPTGPNAVSTETFVDDTYQSLLGGEGPGNANGQSGVSEDGRALLFTVATNRAPAEEAGRVFVRGSVQVRLNRGQPSVATSQLPLTVGQEAIVGPFHTVIRSLSAPGADTKVTVTIEVEGDASRIQKVRVLDGNGKVLNEEGQPPNLFNRFPSGDRPITGPVILRALPKEPVTLEYTFLEKPEPVRIPFEAQVDIGVAKAGPVEAVDGKIPNRTGARTWPPPREDLGETLPPRRAAFNPDADLRAAAANATPAKLDEATVDLFSITVAKPAPSEVKGVEWKNPPSPTFYASGFTIARLMLSTPGANIISVPPDGITVTQFEDNKGGKLDATLYRENPSSSPGLFRSPDGDQMLLSLSLASAPTPGATRCTLTGHVQARVAHGERTSTTGKLELRKGETFAAGPFKGTIGVRQTPPVNPALQDTGAIEVGLTVTGPVSKLRSVVFLDSNGALLIGQGIASAEPLPERADIPLAFRFPTAPTGPVTLHIRHYESEETVQIPFVLSTGIGL